jgi:YVTN family beta-propeller protein
MRPPEGRRATGAGLGKTCPFHRSGAKWYHPASLTESAMMSHHLPRRDVPRRLFLGGLAASAAALTARGQPLSARPLSAEPGLVYVLNSRDATISVLDAATGAERAKVPTLREPHHLVYTPDRREIIVGDSAGNEFQFLDPNTGAVTRRMRISNPYHLLYSPDRTMLTVASLRRDQIDIYDAATLELRHRLSVPDMPSHIAWSPDSRVTWVTLQGNSRIAAVEAATGRLMWTAPTGKTPAGIVFDAQHGLVVANMGEDSITVQAPGDGRIIRRVRTGAGAHNVFPSPDGLFHYVTNRVANTISALDAGTLAPLRTFRAPGAPDCLDFSADGRQLWFTQRVANRVGVLDLETGKMLANITVGRSPHGILFHALA